MAKLDWTKTKGYKRALNTPAPVEVGQVIKSRMQMGQHKHEYIHDVPTDYLRWLVDNTQLQQHAQRPSWVAELERRETTTYTQVEFVDSATQKPAHLLKPTASEKPKKAPHVVTQPRDLYRLKKKYHRLINKMRLEEKKAQQNKR